MNRKGYSIIEVLVVIAIGAVLAAGIITAYRFMAKENVSRVLVVKSESDVESMLYQVVKDIETAGFGIEKHKLEGDSTLICGVCQQNTNDAGILVGNSLSYYSLASREERYSGCWAAIRIEDNTLDVEESSPADEYLGKFRKNFFWQPCHLKDSDTPEGVEIKMKANYYYVIMTRNRVKREVPDLCSDGLCQCGYGTGIQCDEGYRCSDPNESGTCDKEILYAFFATKENNLIYPQDFRVTYFLQEDNQQNRFCAPNEDGKVYSLYKRVTSNPSQPVINCVLKDSLRFRAGIRNGSTVQYTESIDEIRQAIRDSKLQSVKMCLVVQIGGRTDSVSTPQKPQFTNQDCGSDPVLSDTWWNQTGRYYRWKVIEKEIPLYNLQ